jgi:hypothetical protein
MVYMYAQVEANIVGKFRYSNDVGKQEFSKSEFTQILLHLVMCMRANLLDMGEFSILNA